jgi:transglutaminase-like putative cysteine protease
MDARYHVLHSTRYRYACPVRLSRQLLRLKPLDTAWQQCLSHELRVTPTPGELYTLNDFFGNPVAQFALHMPHQELLVEVESEVLVRAHAPEQDPDATLSWEEVRRWLHDGIGEQVLDPNQYLFSSPYVPVSAALADYARPSFPPGRPLLAAALDLTRRIHQDFEYDSDATTVSTPVEEVLQQRRGVCQDFSHLQIACLRSLGIAARYVSGYMLTMPPPGQPRLIGVDASHAWVSVYCPDLGWVDLDPTNDLMVDTLHVTVACGRDFSDVSPIHGVILGGGEHELEVQVTVRPVEE